VLGLSAYALLLALALAARDRTQTYYTAGLAAAGGLAAVALVGLQAFKIGVFCKWCVMVDGAAMVAAVAGVVVHERAKADAAFEAWLGSLARRRGLIAGWVAGAVIAGVMPVVWGEYPVLPPLPPGVAALAVPGKISVVAFTDFECPYCRLIHPVIDEIVAGSGGRMTLVRKMVPLPGHHGARPAALAFLCTPEHRRDVMANALYAVPPERLSDKGVVTIARSVGLDPAAVAECLAAPETSAALDRDLELFESLDARALPYTFIGPRVVAGNNPELARKAARLALAGDRPSLPVAWMLAAFGLLAAALVGLTLRLAPGDEPT
jgi:hypothetical protein